MKDTSKNQDIHISSVYSDNENLVDLLENQHGLTLLETDINDILHAVKQDRNKTNTAMKDLTKYFIDLSKLSEEGQKDIFSLLPEPITSSQYKIFSHYKYLYYDKKMDLWIVTSIEVVCNKSELTYPEFIKLFEGGEGGESIEHICQYCGCLTTQPDSDCYANPNNTLETLYRKVSVSEPSQFENNVHYYFVDFDGNIMQDKFLSHASFDEYTHRYKYFLVEIPDPTAQLQADKEELLEALEGIKPSLRYFPEKLEEIESLIQKHKQ